MLALFDSLCGLCQSKTALYTDYEALLDSAYIVGELNVYLGLISADTSHPNSIMNPYGEHGSDVSSHSIFVAYLGENERVLPRVSTYSLIGFLYDEVKKSEYVIGGTTTSEYD